MSRFDLKQAREGAEVQTRSGGEVTIIMIEKDDITAIVEHRGKLTLTHYGVDGKSKWHPNYDLMMA